MAIISLSADDNYSKFNRAKEVEVTIELSTSGASDWYESPLGTSLVTAELIPISGTAKVQATIDTSGAEAGNIDGTDWPSGDVTVTTQDAIIGSPLIRLSVSSGSAKVILNYIRSV